MDDWRAVSAVVRGGRGCAGSHTGAGMNRARTRRDHNQFAKRRRPNTHEGETLAAATSRPTRAPPLPAGSSGAAPPTGEACPSLSFPCTFSPQLDGRLASSMPRPHPGKHSGRHQSRCLTLKDVNSGASASRRRAHKSPIGIENVGGVTASPGAVAMTTTDETFVRATFGGRCGRSLYA